MLSQLLHIINQPFIIIAFSFFFPLLVTASGRLDKHPSSKPKEGAPSVSH